jgi:hypothetical protein
MLPYVFLVLALSKVSPRTKPTHVIGQSTSNSISNYFVGKSDFALLKETIQLAKAMKKAIEFQLSELDVIKEVKLLPLPTIMACIGADQNSEYLLAEMSGLFVGLLFCSNTPHERVIKMLTPMFRYWSWL